MSLYSRLHPTLSDATIRDHTFVRRHAPASPVWCAACGMNESMHGQSDTSGITAPTLSPFTRRALARELPSKDLTR